MSVGSLGKGFIDLRIDTKGLKTGLKAVKRMFSVAFGAIKATIIASVGAFVALGAGIFAATKAASDYQESLSKFETVFKDLKGAAMAWVEETADALGRNRGDIVKWMASLQDTFVPFGIARDKAFKLSKQVTQLGIDLASFNNLDTDETIGLMTSALVGNHEAVRRFGIVITEATLKAKLLEMGIEGGTKAASNEEKMMARLALMMSMTTDAQGDAARTAGSFANQMVRLWSTVKDAAIEIGNKFIPAGKELIPVLIDIVKEAKEWALGLIDIGKEINALIQPIKDVFTSLIKDGLDVLSTALGGSKNEFIDWAETISMALSDILVKMSRFKDSATEIFAPKKVMKDKGRVAAWFGIDTDKMAEWLLLEWETLNESLKIGEAAGSLDPKAKKRAMQDARDRFAEIRKMAEQSFREIEPAQESQTTKNLVAAAKSIQDAVAKRIEARMKGEPVTETEKAEAEEKKQAKREKRLARAPWGTLGAMPPLPEVAKQAAGIDTGASKGGERVALADLAKSIQEAQFGPDKEGKQLAATEVIAAESKKQTGLLGALAKGREERLLYAPAFG